MPQAADARTLFLRNAGMDDLAEASLPPVLPTPLHFARHDGSLHWPTRPSVVAAASAGAQIDTEIEFANRLLDQYYPSHLADVSVPPLIPRRRTLPHRTRCVQCLLLSHVIDRLSHRKSV